MKNKSILVLEDDDMSYKLTYEALKDYNLFRAKTTSEAIKYLEDFYSFDLFIVDVYIKGSRFNGFDFIKLLEPTDKVLVYTALDITYIIENKKSKYMYLQKPVIPTELKKFISNIM